MAIANASAMCRQTGHAPLELRLPELEEGEEHGAHDSCLRHPGTHASEEPAHSFLLDRLLEHLASHGDVLLR